MRRGKRAKHTGVGLQLENVYELGRVVLCRKWVTGGRGEVEHNFQCRLLALAMANS